MFINKKTSDNKIYDNFNFFSKMNVKPKGNRKYWDRDSAP
jgi:hypothetical protein